MNIVEGNGAGQDTVEMRNGRVFLFTSPLYTAPSCEVVPCSPLVHGTLVSVFLVFFLRVVGSLCVVFVGLFVGRFC